MLTGSIKGNNPSSPIRPPKLETPVLGLAKAAACSSSILRGAILLAALSFAIRSISASIELLVILSKNDVTALVPPPIKPLTKALSKSSLPSVIALLTNSLPAPCTKPPTTFSGTMLTPVPDATPKFSASIPPGFSPPTIALDRVCAGSMLPVLTNCPAALDTPAAPAVPNAPPPK